MRPLFRFAAYAWLVLMVAACADGGTVRLQAAAGAPPAVMSARAASAEKDAPGYPLAEVLAYIAANDLYDPEDVHQAALAAGLSAAQLDALYGLPAGSAVNYLTLQGWAPLPGGTVIEGLDLPTPVYPVDEIRQVIADAALQEPERVYWYARGAQLDALQVDALYGLAPGTAAAYIAAQGWEPLAGGAVVDGLDMPLSDISAGTLAYGTLATFTISGDDLSATAVYIGLEKCSNAAVLPGGSNTEQRISCRVSGTGTLTITARNAEDTVLLSRSFTVPRPRVAMATNLGEFVLELDPERAPRTVDNFLRYVGDGFYAGTLFHRVVPGFVVQGGGFNPGPLYKTPTYAPIPLESNNGLSNLRATVAMARTSLPDSATSQFYVNLVDNGFLDYASSTSPGYAVFGEVISGMDVIDAIAAVPTATVSGLQNVPLADVVIQQALRTQ